MCYNRRRRGASSGRDLYTRTVEQISFARGIPAPECLPVEELADCAQAVLDRDGRTVLSYGSAAGYEPLREWIAARHGVESPIASTPFVRECS